MLPVDILTYIQSPYSYDGLAGPYIDTGIVDTTVHGVMLRFLPLETQQERWYSYLSSYIDNFTLGVAYRPSGFYVRWRGLEKLYVDNNVISTTVPNTVEINNGIIAVNGLLTRSCDTTYSCGTSGRNVLVFACQTDSRVSRRIAMRLYELLLYGQGGVVIQHFLPARRKKDNTVGLYDLVSASFFENAGTGTFSPGIKYI